MNNPTFHKKNQAGQNSLLRVQETKPVLSENLYVRKLYRLIEIRTLTPEAYVMRFDRNGMAFKAGQHITLGIPGDNQVREYSVYSTEQDDAFEVLIKEVPEGSVSRQLRRLIPGELLDVDGPFGYFTIPAGNLARRHLFIGTGTGIAPFRSITGSYPQLNYMLLHGVRLASEAYEKHLYPAERFRLCTSRDDSGDFSGRVTDYLRQHFPDQDTMVYLCGNCDMIYDVYDLLTSGGFPSANIKTEVYF